MHDSKHPVWIILKALIFWLFATLFAYTNSTNFDETEYRMLFELGVVLFGSAAIEIVRKK
jgi:hypothetical protein